MMKSINKGDQHTVNNISIVTTTHKPPQPVDSCGTGLTIILLLQPCIAGELETLDNL